MREFVSKNIDGITDLIVIAPIKDGFIEAYDNITYATRLKLVAEALNRIRVAAREYERVSPYTDTIERILNILNFRITVFDEDMYGLVNKGMRKPPADDQPASNILELKPKRYLCIVATFEGGWEPYMRLIWRPFGSLMDLLFCNCEDFLSAYDHSCEEYLQWVRDHLVDPSIFYSVNGLSTRDGRYLMRLERMQRAGWSAEELAQLTMPHPDNESGELRRATGRLPKTIEVAFEALTVLYRLADYYPPQWYTGNAGSFSQLDEGHRLIRFAREILRGWDDVIASMDAYASMNPDTPIALGWQQAKALNQEPLAWYQSGLIEVDRREAELEAQRNDDPEFDSAEVQGGILKAQGSKRQPVRHGALLLFTIQNAQGARDFIDRLRIHYADGEGSEADGSLYRTIGFTEHGLLRLGLDPEVVKCLPKEFREGMAVRSGTLGDYRENHSRNWILPERNGPILTGEVAPGTKLSRIDTEEIDLVVQLRSTDPNEQVVTEDIKRLAAAGGAAVSLEGYEMLRGGYDPVTGQFRDHFEYLDGLSQPWPDLPNQDPPEGALERDRVKVGEVLVGYANDRTDAAPGPFRTLEGEKSKMAWRAKLRAQAQSLTRNGTFLVVRKIGQDVDAFEQWLTESAKGTPDRPGIAKMLGVDIDTAKSILKSAVMGRDGKGNPLVGSKDDSRNDFDYSGDEKGVQCPFAAHIRRANPRHTVPPPQVPDNSFGPLKPFTNNTIEFKRPTPRILRRGMLFGGNCGGPEQRGLMFMAYNASIAEQYEVIQRWLNGGNSTDVASMQNDPLTGVTAKEIFGHTPNDTFRFFAKNNEGKQVLLHVPLRAARSKDPNDPRSAGEPGFHPFTPLHWGLYLLVPSRSGLARIVSADGEYKPMPEPLERERGQAALDKLQALSVEERGKEWKRLIEDVDAKDPAMVSDTPHLWSAIRWLYDGAFDLRSVGQTNPSAPGTQARVGRAGTIPNKDGRAMRMGANAAIPEIQFDAAEVAEGTTDNAKSKEDETVSSKPDPIKQNIVFCVGRSQVRRALHNWKDLSNEEQLRRMLPGSGAIYVNQRPDGVYHNEFKNPDGSAVRMDYEKESVPTNALLMSYNEEKGFAEGYTVARKVLDEARNYAVEGRRNYFKLELRRLFLHPALALLMKQWYGLPDGENIEPGSWSWKRIDPSRNDLDPAADPNTRRLPRCPGDFLAPSRAAYFPRPRPVTSEFGLAHGKAIHDAAMAFVKQHRGTNGPPVGYLSKGMFEAFPCSEDDEILARTIVGTMVGALPPMDGNIRGVLVEWFGERTFWRHQAALRRKVGGNLGPALDETRDLAKIRKAIDTLRGPVSQTMCKRPAPDLLYRTANKGAEIELGSDRKNWGGQVRPRMKLEEGDLVIISQVSAAQRSLSDNPETGDISFVFGGKRTHADQRDSTDLERPVHACPAQKLAMGAMMGILAALLDFGTVEALPASLIVRFSDW